MMEFDGALRQLLGQIARKKQLEAVVQEQTSRLEYLRNSAERLRRIMEQEQADVDRLEGRSLAAFFYGVVGKMDDKLTKERQEAYAARVKYDAAARELSSLEEDLSRNQAELRELEGCQEAYERLLREKAERLKQAGGQTASELLRLEKQLAYLEQQRRELREAIDAGETARNTADRVLAELDSAQGWATWDVLGGGVLTDMAKYSKIDNAQNLVETLQIQLQRFKTELADVTIETDLQVSTDGFLRFADYFFDNIFTDWSVMNQIGSAQERTAKTRQQIDSVLQGLEAVRQQRSQEEAETRQRLDQLIRETSLT